MKTPHPHAKWLLLIAEDKDIKLEYLPDQLYIYQAVLNDEVLRAITYSDPFGKIMKTLRVKQESPKTIRIGSYDVPEPMRVAPANGTKYYCLSNHGGVFTSLWEDYETDRVRLANNRCWANREDAELAAEAITGLLGGGV